MWITVKASASSEAFLCSAPVTNLGQAGRWYLTEDSRPRAMLTVSRTSATRPVARVRYHRGVEELTTRAIGGPAAGLPVTLERDGEVGGGSCGLGWPRVVRPARDGFDGPVVPDQAGGQPGLAQPGEGRLAADDRRGAGRVGVDAAPGGHAHGPPAGLGGPARGPGRDVMHPAAAPGPRA